MGLPGPEWILGQNNVAKVSEYKTFGLVFRSWLEYTPYFSNLF